MKQKLNGLQSVMSQRESSFLSFSFFFSVGLPKEWAQPIRGEVDWTGRHQNCSRLSLAERTYKSYRAVWRRLKWEPPRSAFVMFGISDVHLEMNYRSLSNIVKAAPKKPKNGLKFYKSYFNCGKGCLQYFTMFTFSFFWMKMITSIKMKPNWQTGYSRSYS